VSHVEFPELTNEANAAYLAAFPDISDPLPVPVNRRCFAAFLREAIEQATENHCIVNCRKLRAIADNLHIPPPPPPTLAQARAADLDTPAGRDVVHAFLATLGEAP
jgi:hypothetical protein